MATCDDLAVQITELQKRKIELQAEIDDPEHTCEGLSESDCVLLLKELRRERDAIPGQIAEIQRQQYLQGCLGQQVMIGTLYCGGAEIAIALDPNHPFDNERIVPINATLTFVGNPGSPWDVAELTLDTSGFRGGSVKLSSYNGGSFNAVDGSMNLNVVINVNVLNQDSKITLCLTTGPIQAGPYSLEGSHFDKSGQTITLASAGQFIGGQFDKNYGAILMAQAFTSNWPQG